MIDSSMKNKAAQGLIHSPGVKGTKTGKLQAQQLNAPVVAEQGLRRDSMDTIHGDDGVDDSSLADDFDEEPEDEHDDEFL